VGYYTRRTAQAGLQEYLVALRSGATVANPRTGVTFADAAAEGSGTWSTAAGGRS
jgi:hypothetical protein